MKDDIYERACRRMKVFYLGRQTLATLKKANTLFKHILIQVNMRRHGGIEDRRTKGRGRSSRSTEGSRGVALFLWLGVSRRQVSLIDAVRSLSRCCM